MSEEVFTPRNAADQGLAENLARYLAFLGVDEHEFVELAGLGTKTVYVGGARGVEAIIELAKMGGMLTAGRGSRPLDGLYIVANRAVHAVGARYEPNTWHVGLDRVKDHQIERRRVLYIDLDPARIPGTSSTAAERQAARKAAEAVIGTLKLHLDDRSTIGLGFSGNGFQVHVAVDLPNTPQVEATIRTLLAVLAALHGGDHGYGHHVDVDTTVYNAGQLAPAFGTMKRKGHDNTGDEPDPIHRRPHRRSWFWCRPNPKRLGEADLAELAWKLEANLTPEEREGLAPLEPGKSTARSTSAAATPAQGNLMALAKNYPIAEVVAWLGLAEGDGKVKCPGCGEIQGVDILAERNRVKCLHNRCSSKGRNNGCRSNIDLVIEVNGWSPDKTGVKQAAEAICKHFGLAYQKGKVKAPPPTVAELSALAGLSLEESAALVGIIVDTDGVVSASSNDDGVPNSEGSQGEERTRRNLTDLGNAERLVDRCGKEVRFVSSWKKWVVWDGKRWNEDIESLLVRGLAHQTVRSIYAEAAACADPAERRAVASWAKKSEATARIGAMLTEAEAIPSVRLHHEDLDADPFALNMQNGILNLKTGKLMDHDRAAFCTKITKVKYNPEADRSVFEQSFAKSLPATHVREYVLKLLGKSLTGDTKNHVLPVHYGAQGRNGKGTFLGALRHLMGEYADEVPFEILEATGGQHPTGLSLLFGRRFVLSSETGKGEALNVKLAKRLTGEDRIQTRKMGQDFWGFDPGYTFHLATNHKPRIVADPKDPFWQRVALIEWTY